MSGGGGGGSGPGRNGRRPGETNADLARATPPPPQPHYSNSKTALFKIVQPISAEVHEDFVPVQ